MSRTFKLDELGYEVTVGKFATQAHGNVWFKVNDTVILTTAVMAESKDFPGFLPLSVDYREQFSAAGKIPGGYLKREGKSSDKEVLTSRLIDRALRPLFPDQFFHSVQILSTVYSIDRQSPPAVYALIASSLSLVLSKIPFLEPVGAVQVGRVGGEWIINPTHEQSNASDVKLTVAGTKDGICMVEGSSENLSEVEMVDAFFVAHQAIKKIVAWQLEISKELAIEKEAIYDFGFDWNLWTSRIQQHFASHKLDIIFHVGSDKKALDKAITEIKDEFLMQFSQDIENLGSSKVCLDYLLDTLVKDIIAQDIVKRNVRVDGRNFTQVRKISTEVGFLPSVHGSSLFQRGNTQALISVTLGSSKDAQKVDDLLQDEPLDLGFMLHYNFPPFAVGEVKGMRSPGRREIGHGYLALAAISQVLPDKKDFPYTIRVISDILESNGSSSMATVCGTTMGLMDAGVPVSDMVGGIAMGLLVGSDGKTFQAITDITGFEDALGLMDFKVAGTDKGINSIQMDIKYKGGLPREVFIAALQQAKDARLHILGEMRKVLAAPKPEMSPLVPRITSVSIDPNKVGGVIGSGGKIIKEIIEKTGTTIDIEGSDVNIYGNNPEGVAQAVNWVKILADQIDKGLILQGTIARFAEFGLFVDIAPGKSGLVHISKIPKAEHADFEKNHPIGSPITVEVLDFDPESGRIRLDIVKKS